MNITKMIRLFALLLLCNGMVFMAVAQKPQKWVAPAQYKTMKNPSAGNAESVNTGKDLYAKHCKSCHGKDGLGDGPKASSLDASCGDFTAAAFQSQTDGEIFYKITQGKDKMPAYAKTLPEDADRWALVNYLRKMK
jgi:mono/diheme cytochrome c family protein